MDCDICKYLDEHPFIRDGDRHDYCDKYNEKIEDLKEADIVCEYFEEIEWEE